MNQLVASMHQRAGVQVVGNEAVDGAERLELHDGREVNDVIAWLNRNGLAEVLKRPSVDYDEDLMISIPCLFKYRFHHSLNLCHLVILDPCRAIDHEGPYRDGMYRIFEAFSQVRHPD